MHFGDGAELPHPMVPDGAHEEIPIHRNEMEELRSQIVSLAIKVSVCNLLVVGFKF